MSEITNVVELVGTATPPHVCKTWDSRGMTDLHDYFSFWITCVDCRLVRRVLNLPLNLEDVKAVEKALEAPR